MYLWGTSIYPLIVFVAVSFCAASAEGSSGSYDGTPFLDLMSFAYFLGAILISIRRLKDLGKSGWFILLGFVPLVNLIFGLWLLLAPGTSQQLVVASDRPAQDTDSWRPSIPPQPPPEVTLPQRHPLSVQFCPSCGSQVIRDAQYCMNCGVRLPAGETQ